METHIIKCLDCGAEKEHKIWIKSYICRECVEGTTTHKVQPRQKAKIKQPELVEA